MDEDEAVGETKELTVLIGYTKNIGNYQSLRIDLGETVTLKPGDNVDKAFGQLWNRVDDRLSAEVQKATDRIG